MADKESVNAGRARMELSEPSKDCSGGANAGQKHCFHRKEENILEDRHGHYAPDDSFRQSKTIINICCWCGEKRP